MSQFGNYRYRSRVTRCVQLLVQVDDTLLVALLGDTDTTQILSTKLSRTHLGEIALQK